MRSNLLPIITAIFMFASLGFLGWQFFTANSGQNYWSEKIQSNGLWLSPDNVHVAKLVRGERFTGYITESSIDPDYPDTQYVHLMIDSKNANTPQPIFALNLPAQIVTNNLSYIVLDPAKGTTTTTKLTKSQALDYISSREDLSFTAMGIANDISSMQLDYISLLSFYSFNVPQ